MTTCPPLLTCTEALVGPAQPFTQNSPVDTWKGIFFSGLFGSLIGAAATILAIVLTIRHEAKVRREDALDKLAEDAEVALSNARMSFITEGLLTPRSTDLNSKMIQRHSAVMVGATGTEPEFRLLLIHGAQELQTAAENLGTTADADKAYIKLTQKIATALARWRIDPDSIRFNALTWEKVSAIIDSVDPDTSISKLSFPDVRIMPWDRFDRWRKLRRRWIRWK